jgi:hypothetical protein
MNEEIKKIKTLLTNTFELELFEASLTNLDDMDNKLRYNNFAYSIRELSRHFLHNLAPDNELKACSWFRPETADGKPTRHQRIKYAIQGGIDDDILEKWGLDPKEFHEVIGNVKQAIGSLSKYTHINPEVFNLNQVLVEDSSRAVLESFAKLVESIENHRYDLKQSLDANIQDHMILSVVSNFFGNLESLAPHYSIEYSEVSEYYVSEINANEIVVIVEGLLHVVLEYGSRQERREGDGLDLHEEFPFEATVRYDISEDFPNGKFSVEEYDVDTSSWFGDDDDDT